jgi:hypothetical protein
MPGMTERKKETTLVSKWSRDLNLTQCFFTKSVQSSNHNNGSGSSGMTDQPVSYQILIIIFR